MAGLTEQRATEQGITEQPVTKPFTALISKSSGIGLAERIESVKAGLVGAVATGLAFGTIALMHAYLLTPQWQTLIGIPTQLTLLNLSIRFSFVALSGFLFGVTYRYIIRQDRNPHLRSGSVLAFGLVRGLAQVDALLPTQPNAWLLAVLVLENLVLFVVAQLVLDWVMAQGWIKSFDS